MAKRGTIRDARRFIKAREDFDCGNLTGGEFDLDRIAFPRTALRQTYLPKAWAERFIKDDPTYVVMSYGTPIAWIAADGREVVPYVIYSVSTTRHQSEARLAMDTVNWWKLREPAPYEVAA